MFDFKPIEISRKEKSKCTYYELYSMKNKRNIQLYSQTAYYQALVLEMNFTVKSYCERPRIFGYFNEDISKAKTVDFIVEYYESNVYEIQRIIPYGDKDITPTMNQRLMYELDWCHLHGYRYQIITFETKKNSYYLQNIKYLYGLIRRINSPIYGKYVELISHSLQKRDTITISYISKENNLSQYEAFRSVSFGLYCGIFKIPLEFGSISLDTEVKLVQ